MTGFRSGAALTLALVCLFSWGRRPAWTEEMVPRADRRGDLLPAGAVARLGTVRFRHGDRIDSLAYSPDGKLLASSSQDRTVRLWQPSTGREVRRLDAGQAVFHIAWSPDGRLLACGGQERVVQLWDVAAGVKRRELEHLDPVLALGFSRDGKQLFTAGVRVRLWDLATGREVRRFPGGATLTAAALSPSGRVLVTAGQGQPVVLWDTVTGKEVRRIDVPGPWVDCLAFAPDGNILAVDCLDNRVRLIGVADGREIRALRRPSGGAWGVVFSADGRWLACGGREVPLRVWDALTGKEVPGFRNNSDLPCTLAFAPDDKTLASAGTRRVVRFWDVPGGRERFPAGNESVEPGLLQWASDGRSLFTRSEQTVDEWRSGPDGEEGWRVARQFRLKGKRTGQVPLAVAPNGKMVVAGGKGGEVFLWDWRTDRQTARLQGSREEVVQLTYSDDGSVLVSRGGDGTVLVWEAETGRLLRQLPPDGPAGVAVPAPDGQLVAVCGKKVTIWDVSTGRERGQSAMAYAWTLKAAIAPESRVLVTGSLMGVIQLWQVDGGQELRRWGGEEGGVTALAVSPDGRSLATGHPAGGGIYDIRLWERASGKERRLFRGHQGYVIGLAFSPDGRLLASASEDRTALLWDTAGPALPASTSLRAADLEGLWSQLGEEDASAAYDALLMLAAHPAEAVLLLRRHLRPVPGLDARQVARWIDALDSDQFTVREQASRELDRLGELAGPALKRTLTAHPSLEMRRRIERLLERHDRPEQPGPDGLRQVRALEVLERAGTAEARSLIGELAGGAAEARLTREAKASRARLARRPASPQW